MKSLLATVAIKSRSNETTRRSARNYRRRIPPSLETLEDRMCPSTIIDARALSLSITEVDATEFFSSQVQTLDLAAGPHILREPNFSGAAVTFNVAADGTVSFDHSLAGVLSAQGNTLTVLGSTVVIDARPLSPNFLFLDGAFEFSTTSAITAVVLPGSGHRLFEFSDTAASATFNVANDGTVSFGSSETGVLAAQGNTLTVNGRTVTIDSHALSVPDLNLDNRAQFSTTSVYSAAVVPGHGHFLHQAQLASARVTFNVAQDGTVSFSSSENGILAANGSTLMVFGRTVTLNTGALSLPSLIVDAEVTVPKAAANTVTLLPGPNHSLINPSDQFSQVAFTIQTGGAISYSSALQLSGVLSGMKTTTLTVNGEVINVDARALAASSSTFTILGINSFSTSTVQAITLLPGWQFCSVGAMQFDFLAELFDMVEYDPSEDAFLSGRDTNTLVVTGLPTGTALSVGVVTPVAPAAGFLEASFNQTLPGRIGDHTTKANIQGNKKLSGPPAKILSLSDRLDLFFSEGVSRLFF
jgi:hypothetical protein